MNIEEVLNYNPKTNIPSTSSANNSNGDDNNDQTIQRKRKRLNDYQFGQPSSSSSGVSSSVNVEKFIGQQQNASTSSASTSSSLEGVDQVNELDENLLKRWILQLERRILKNQEMRIKYSDNPSKFMDSEIELFDIIKELHVVATQPSLYGILIELNIIPKLLGLLSHENTDIACAIVALIQELTDLDDVDEIDEVSQLMEELINHQITILLVTNMERLDENVKEESEGIYNSLAIIENLTDYKPELSKDVRPLIQWILRKLKSKPIFYGNKLYASEILSILLQNSAENRIILGQLNGIDILLHVVSYYKRHDPMTADEEEFVENLFNCLCSSLFECQKNRELFFKAEGIELMILILKEKRKKESNTDVRVCALKLLSHMFSNINIKSEINNDNNHQSSSSSSTSTSNLTPSMICDKFVEILGLRILMPIFLKPSTIIGYRRKRKQSLIDQIEEHSLTIILQLLRYCRHEYRQRVLNKFFEQNYLKTERLVELHLKYYERLQKFDNDIKNEYGIDLTMLEDNPEMKENIFLKRLNEGGLFILQLIDHIIIILSNEYPNEIKEEKILKLLNMHQNTGKSIDHRQIIKMIMNEYIQEQQQQQQQLEPEQDLTMEQEVVDDDQDTKQLLAMVDAF